MSWSLGLRSGDLDVQNAHLGVVNGSQKLVQDFRCAILTPMGHDPLHPTWGSLMENVIATDFRTASTLVETEVRRIGAELQARQLTRVRAERLRHNKVTLTASEILVGIVSVTMMQVADTLQVRVVLATGSGTDISVVLPLANETLVAT